MKGPAPEEFKQMRREVQKELWEDKEYREKMLKHRGIFKKGSSPWNKGLKIQTNTGRTHFKKGEMNGNKHPQYKHGKYCYRDVIPPEMRVQCWECFSHKNIDVHHKDGNRENNDISNLEVLCHSCHIKKHAKTRTYRTGKDHHWYKNGRYCK